MTSKILCATDGTENSTHAVELAGLLAAKLGASLSICAVNVARGGVRGPLIYNWEDAEVKSILDAAAKTARKAGASQVDELALRSREAASARQELQQEAMRSALLESQLAAAREGLRGQGQALGRRGGDL